MAPTVARKRRKLSPPVSPASSAASSGYDASPAKGAPEDASPVNLRAEGRTRISTNEPSKSKRRIHIVRDDLTANDEYFTQLPISSQSPHRIRGAYWQKEPPQQATTLNITYNNDGSNGNIGPVSHRQIHSSRLASNAETNGSILPASITEPQGLPQPRRLPAAAHNNHSADDETALLEELADFPLDMLSPPANNSSGAGPVVFENELNQAFGTPQISRAPAFPSTTSAHRSNFRQTTLFGGQAGQPVSGSEPSQQTHAHNWPLASRDESPTHHVLDYEHLNTWIYPTNLGTIRDYQYNIVARGLFSNLLVALPTGLGKTFVAAAIMLNWFRWTRDSQIVFVAPTRPLVAQQVKACFEIAGIPRSATSLLTGNVAPGLRATEWASKRVFFMTPQTIVNDLKTGICDPKRIVLVVVDEAHRATGNYAYVEVVRFLRRFNESFRVLALTATPGSTVESVQEVIDGLGIARTEIRTEDSLDIRQYVHQRSVDSMLFEYDDDMLQVMNLLSNAIKPVLNIVTNMNIYWSKDPMALTAFGCTQARQKWMQSPAGRAANFGIKGMVNSILNTLASLAHAIELLKFHGIRPFYRKALSFESDDAENGKKGGKYKNQILQHQDFKKMMSTVRQWTSNVDFLGHPKLEYLSQVVLNHFIDAGQGSHNDGTGAEATRVMIFAHFRDSAEEIVRALERHSPLVRPHIFVGQAASRMSEGMNQKKQQVTIDEFKKGKYNTLVATSIGEEGLDIGQVDLIVCYDASASPIRMLQRMGRTGRKRAGNITVLLMKKKEHENFEKAKDNYEKMQLMIAEGTRFVYHTAFSPRIVPKGITPTVDKRDVEIPLENSQIDELPEPKKTGRTPKRPPKKFHMPDGVITGFLKASEVEGGRKSIHASRKTSSRRRSPTPEPVPAIGSVMLSAEQESELETNYLDIGGSEEQQVEYPRLNRYVDLQREERPSKLVAHGTATWRVIQMLNDIHDMDKSTVQRYQRSLRLSDKEEADDALEGISRGADSTSLSPSTSARKKQAKPPAKTQAKRRIPKTQTNKAANFVSASAQAESTMSAVSTMGSMGAAGDTCDDSSANEDYEDYDDDDNGSDLLDFIDDATQVPQAPSSASTARDLLEREQSGDTAPVALSQATDASLPDAEALFPSSEEPRSAKRHKGNPRGRRRQVIREDSDDDDDG